ncbi:MAG: cyclic nucleotide-binding domain protein [Firmicutes bacterium]|nr:cyclic nucleotide-binding domain protein [Bacillota bacterium]
MLIPSYFFTNDFKQFYEYFLSQPHIKKSFKKGDYLWEPNKPFEKIHYIISGVAQNYLEHENGHRKILSFHGSGTVFPGYHEQDYKIESALITVALSDMEVLEFTKVEFRRMFQQNQQLSAQDIDWFSKDVNLLLYETAHQEYNNSFIKLCNLLYLLLVNETGKQNHFNCMTQDDIADILGISRVNLTRGLTRLRKENIIITKRKQIQVIDPSALEKYCSLETL